MKRKEISKEEVAMWDPLLLLFFFSPKLSRKYDGREETLYTIIYPKQLFYYVLFHLLLFNQTIGGRDIFL